MSRGPIQRGLKINGMFTDDELLDIIEVVRRVERTRPDQEFTAAIDDPKATREEAKELMGRVPLDPDYIRVGHTIVKNGPDRDELVDRLKRIQEKVDTADWLSRAENPNRFAQFCNEIQRIIDVDNLEGSP